MIIQDIKNKIKAKLDTLVVAGTLKEIQMDDFKVGIFDREFASFPVAILTSPSVIGEVFMNTMNERTHTFNIVIIQKAENITTANDIENLMETIMNAFDNDPLLDGKSDAGMLPAVSSPEPVVSGSKSYVVFVVTMKAKAIKDLTFSY